MPYDEVLKKFAKGRLHSGSKTGKKVTNRKQAVAIMLSEKEKARGGKKEYKAKGKASLAGLKKVGQDFRGEKNGQRV